jgi:hypothetical protein
VVLVADLENKGKAPFADLGDVNLPGEPLESKKDLRAQSSNTSSTPNKDDPKKKQDALEGRESQEGRESGESEDSSHHAADKAEADTSSQRQSLQSGQTTVQFSSGGNMASSLGSLLGLFASSASLSQTQVGLKLSGLNQGTLTLKTSFQSSSNSEQNLFNEGSKNLNGPVGLTVEEASENTISKGNLEISLEQTSHTGFSDPELLETTLKTANPEESEQTNPEETPEQSLFSPYSFPFTYIETFNANAFFFSPQVIFAFPNSAVTGSILLSNGTSTHTLSPFSGIISTYLSTAGLSTSSTYSYQVVNPLPASDIAGWNISKALTSGVTIVPTGNPLSVTLDNLLSSFTNVLTGISLTAGGDLYVNVIHPMSVLLDVKIPGSSIVFPVRIDAGPGDVVTTSNANTILMPRTMVGLTDTTGQPESTVFRDSTGYTIVGNGEGLSIKETGAVSLWAASPAATGSASSATPTPETFILPSSGAYNFPGNTIYRHVGTSDSTAAENPTYGNFADYNKTGGTSLSNTIDLPQAPASYTLTMGGNVLDVYGTKYGVADTLTVVLSTSSGTVSALPTNTLTMGGNTLAGFGLAYGDLRSLNLEAPFSSNSTTLTQIPSGGSLLAPTNIIFNSNLLEVDKPVDSTLYPHLQTLNIEMQTTPGQLTQVDNLNIVFNNSILQGNADTNTFYSDIANLGDLGVSTRYNGFITGVTTFTNSNGQLVITTAPVPAPLTQTQAVISQSPTLSNSTVTGTTSFTSGATGQEVATAPLTLTTNPDGSQVLTSNNSITWGNDIYSGGTADPKNPQFIPHNIYNLTLTGTTANQPVMEGNPLISNFNPKTDSLVLDITPALFRTLDVNHNKQPISASELDQVVKDGLIKISANPSSFLQALPTSEGAYLTATTPAGTAITGTTLSFDGGGSLNLDGLNLTSSSTPFETLNTIVTLNLTYSPVSAISPGSSQVFVYGASTTPYYNELDNYFNNSLYATYSINTPLPSGISIDPYGSLTVHNTIPFLGSVTITATDQEGGVATNAPLLGLFGTSVTSVAAGATGVVSSLSQALVGSTGSILIGDSVQSYILDVEGVSTSLSQTYGSSLLVDMAGGATEYGSLTGLAFIADGKDSLYVPGSIHGSTYVFNPTAVAVSGIGYGIASDFSVQVQEGLSLPFIASGGNDSGSFNNNQFYFGYVATSSSHIETSYTETIYGNGTLYGDFNTITFTVEGASLSSLPDKVGTPTTIDLSGQIEGNTFDFAPTSLHVYGDQAWQTTTLYANVDNLNIYSQNSFERTVPSLTLNTSATFSNNEFVFGNAVLTGGAGTTDFYGHLYSFGNPYDFSTTPFWYNGFVDGVTVSTNNNGQMVITTHDGFNNSITWGNDTYTGGTGPSSHNIYNFTLVENTSGQAVMQGFDTITNFNPATDTLVFNIEVNLFNQLGMFASLAGKTPTQLLRENVSDLDQDVSVTNMGSQTIFSFAGGGSITLDGSYPNITSFSQLLGASSTSIQINSQGKGYTPLTIDSQALAQFDPVFINSVQPGVFAQILTNTNPSDLTYTTTGLPSGISLTSNGALDVNVTTAPVANLDVTVTAIDSQRSTPFTVPIFSINATDRVIHRDTTSTVLGDVNDSQAFETDTPGNTIIGGGSTGGGSKILSNPNTLLATGGGLAYGSKLIYDVSTGTGGHTAIGDVQNIQITNTGSSTDINNLTITFGPNLFDVNASSGGGIWGNAKTVELSSTASLRNGVPANSELEGYHLTTGANTLYGAGALYGDIESIKLEASTDATGGISSTTPANGTVALSSSVDHNTFTFGPTSLTIEGDQAGSTNTLVANVLSLSLLEQASYPTSLPLGVTLAIGPYISNNAFTFGNSTLTGGAGTNIFYGHLETLGDPYNFTPLGYTYDGFVDGVNVSVTNEVITITTNDGNHNTITWGNDTYTGGTGKNIYNFTIIEDKNGREVMQGFDTITNFNPATDKLVFNLEANVANQQLSGVTVSNDGTNTLLTFAGGGSLTLDGIVTTLDSLTGSGSIQIIQQGVSYTPIALNQATLAGFNPSTYINPVVMGSNQPQAFADLLTASYNPLALTYTMTTSQSYISLDYFLTGTGNLSGVSLSPDGTFDVNSLTPTYGDMTVSITDPTGHSVSFTTPVFALNATDGVVHTGTGTSSLLTGDITDSQIFETNTNKDATNTFGNTIIGGGGNVLTAAGDPELVFSPDYSPSSGNAVVYGSKLIYDLSIGGIGLRVGGHTAIGDVLTVQFINDGSASGSSAPNVNGQTLTFGPNLFDINGTMYGNTESIAMMVSGLNSPATGAAQANIDNNIITAGPNTILGGGTVFGNDQATVLSAAGGSNISGPIDAHIQDNTFTFGPNTLLLDNAVVGRDENFGYTSFNGVTSTVYGNMGSLTLEVNGASTATQNNVGNASIIGNTFTFGGNTIGDGEGATTVYTSLGSLVMEANGSTNLTGASQISGNTITFGDTVVTSSNQAFGEAAGQVSASGQMSVYGDIADLSQTDFVTQPLTANIVNNHVSVTDQEGNTITWGNDTFIQPSGAADTYTFTLLSPMGYNLGTSNSPIGAIMQGNATIENWNVGNTFDTLVFNIPYALFKTITAQYGYETGYDRTVSGSELLQALFPTLTYTYTSSAVLDFTYGSLTLTSSSSAFSLDTTEIMVDLVAPSFAPVAPANPNPNPAPLVLSDIQRTQANGVEGIYNSLSTVSIMYGNVLDFYFNNIDIGNMGATYTVSNIFANLPSSVSVAFNLPSNLNFDSYGTAAVSSGTSTLRLVTVAPNDPYFPQNVQTLPLTVVTFSDGNIPTDPGTGLFVGNPTASPSITSSLLEGQSAGETMVGGTQTVTLSSSSVALPPVGDGNILINTNAGNTAYGDYQTVTFNIESSGGAITNQSYNFGANSFDVTGTVFGTAGVLSINALNTINNQAVTDSTTNSFSGNTLTFGSSTIYGQGTIYGYLGTLQLNAEGGQNDTVDPSVTSPLSVNAQVTGNTFTFANSAIAIVGTNASIIYPDIDALSFNAHPGTSSTNLDASATIANNTFIFGNNVIISGEGPTNIYPDVNDLSATDFWTSQVIGSQNSGNISFVDANNNTITTGTNTLSLGANQTSPTVIHANLLDATVLDPSNQSGNTPLASVGTPILEGNMVVYNFDPTVDTIRFNLSPEVYSLIGSSSSPITPSSLTQFETTNLATNIPSVILSVSGDNTVIQFLDPGGGSNFGFITLEGVTGNYTSLSEFLTEYPHAIQVGATFVGTGGADTFTFTVPFATNNNFSLFQEYDAIAQFSPTAGTLQVVLPSTLYNTLSAYALEHGETVQDALNASAATSTGGITLTPDLTGTGTDVNFVTNGVTSGSIDLEGVGNISNLSGLNVQLGIEGTSSGGNTFAFEVPGNSFSTFTEKDFVTNLQIPSGATPGDLLQVTVPVTLYNTLSAYAYSQNETVQNALGSSVATLVGGITLTPDSTGTGTDVNFVANGVTTGSIDLEGVGNLSSLSSLNFQLGSQGTSLGSNTFIFSVPNAGTTLGIFTDQTYIHNFTFGTDKLDVTVSPSLYTALNPNLDNPTKLAADLVTSASTATGGITLTPDLTGTGTDVNFVANGVTSGSIDLQGVETVSTSPTWEDAFELGVAGTGSNDTFTYTLPTGSTSFGSFEATTYITNFHPTQGDELQITIPISLYNTLTAAALLNNETTQSTLSASSATATGGITLTPDSAGTGTDVNFVTNGVTSGSIDLEGVSTPSNLSAWEKAFELGVEGTSGRDTFTFDVPANAANPLSFSSFTDATYIKGFQMGTDKILLDLPYSLYNLVAGGNGSTTSTQMASNFLSQITLTQTAADATLTFPGGGSLTLNGYGTDLIDLSDLKSDLTGSIGFYLDNPITAVPHPVNPANNLIILGDTDATGALANYFNMQGHDINATFGGITNITDSSTGTVTYSGSSETGITDAQVSYLTGSDPYTTVTNTLQTPVQVIALDAPVTNQATGTEIGSTAAGVFIGDGNTIVGGGNNIAYTATGGTTSTPTNQTFGDKVIYDVGQGTGTITGDVANVILTTQGVIDDVSTASAPSNLSNTLQEINNVPLVDFNPIWIFSNIASPTYGNAQNIDITATGGTNIFSPTAITEQQIIEGIFVESSPNTITASGDIYGDAQNLSVTATDGFYSAPTGSSQGNSISSSNGYKGGGNQLTGTGNSSQTLIGDVQTLSIEINSPANTGGALIESSDFSSAVTAANEAKAGSVSIYEGSSGIGNDSFNFLGNELTGSSQGGSLYAGIQTLVMENNEQILTNVTQPTASLITQNHITFGNSTETATGGITNFYNDVADLSQTNFGQYGVDVIANTEISDTRGTGNGATLSGNTIQFENDTMNASTAPGAVNIFNFDLLATTAGNIVGEGNTTINNFGEPGPSNANMLDFQLTQALYNDVVAYAEANHLILNTALNASGYTVNLITANIMDAYRAANDGHFSQSNGNTVISFTDSDHPNSWGYTGSITLTGVTTNASGSAINSFASLGTNVEFTAQGVTTIDPAPSPTNVFNVEVTGDTFNSYTQHTDIANLSSLGQVVDFSGEVNLNIPTALWEAAGLSPANTAAQNLQILENSAATPTGGIAVSTTTTGTGANAVTDTVLTFESTSTTGVVNTHGSVTLHDTHFNPADPLQAHLIVTHH